MILPGIQSFERARDLWELNGHCKPLEILHEGLEPFAPRAQDLEERERDLLVQRRLQRQCPLLKEGTVHALDTPGDGEVEPAEVEPPPQLPDNKDFLRRNIMKEAKSIDHLLDHSSNLTADLASKPAHSGKQKEREVSLTKKRFHLNGVLL